MQVKENVHILHYFIIQGKPVKLQENSYLGWYGRSYTIVIQGLFNIIGRIPAGKVWQKTAYRSITNR